MVTVLWNGSGVVSTSSSSKPVSRLPFGASPSLKCATERSRATEIITMWRRRCGTLAHCQNKAPDLRCTEWRPRHATWQFERHGGPAIGELIVPRHEGKPYQAIVIIGSLALWIGAIVTRPRIEHDDRPRIADPAGGANAGWRPPFAETSWV